MSSFTPPPRRINTPSSSSPRTSSPEPSKQGWTSRMKATGAVWGKIAMNKSVEISDKVGGKVNDVAEKRFGTEHFWPVTGDFGRQMEQAGRILRAFTVEGIVQEEKVDKDGPDGKTKTKTKVIRKIPPKVIAQAKGLAIFTSMRTGIMPLGGAGGAGIVVARLPDGSWSAPASISPNNFSAGFLLGVDVYDCVLVIRSQQALDSFATHKATLGAEIGVAAGPYGGGAAMEAGIEKAPVFSYTRSRGLYAGVEVVGQVFVERFEENAAMYHWPGVKAGEILSGKVRVPVEAASLHRALKDAETGRAQREKGEPLDVVVPDGADLLDLEEGETLKLPPTPEMTDGSEHQSDPETERVHLPSRHGSPSSSSRSPKMLPPPRHPRSVPPPPPLPTRSRARPVMVENRSSTSYYSDAEEGGMERPQIPPPPKYNPDKRLQDIPPTTSYPDEKVEIPYVGENLAIPPVQDTSDIPPVIGPPEPDNNDPMSEAERREWDQFLAEHKQEEARTPGERRESDIDLAAVSASAFTIAHPDPALVHGHGDSPTPIVEEEEDDLDSWIAASMDDGGATGEVHGVNGANGSSSDGVLARRLGGHHLHEVDNLR